MQKVKEIAKYEIKTNKEGGAVYAIHKWDFKNIHSLESEQLRAV